MSRFSMLCVCLALVNCPVAAEDIRFPASAGLIDLTQAPYGAVGNGIHDDTAAIQRALDEHSASGAILYLPNGIYLISHTLHWGGGPGEQRFTVLQG